MSKFITNCLPLLIGSLPFDSHIEATDLIYDYTAAIPLWPQLPRYKEEGMIPQYATGFPGLTEVDGKIFIDTNSPSFATDLLAFYEEYLLVTEGGGSLDDSRFQLFNNEARGFYTFLDIARVKKDTLIGLKGQTTGPITFCMGLTDQAGRAIFYDDQLRDVAVKLLAMKAKWQLRQMDPIAGHSLMFFDEPGLASFGSSAFITVTHEDIRGCFAEVFTAVRGENGLVGVHVCANTEWSLLFDSDVDIVSYDAYSFFDKLLLYAGQLAEFLKKGGILATGIVPTVPEFIDVETVDSLFERWLDQTKRLQAIGIDRKTVYRQSLITPSCGMGTIPPEYAHKVLALTRGLAEKIRMLFI